MLRRTQPVPDLSFGGHCQIVLPHFPQELGSCFARIAQKLANYGHRISSSRDHRPAILNRDPAECYYRLARQRASPPHAFESNRWVGIVLRRGGKHRPNRNVVSRSLRGCSYLPRIVRRDPNNPIWTDNPPHSLWGNVLLPDVDAVRPRSPSQVGAIIDD